MQAGINDSTQLMNTLNKTNNDRRPIAHNIEIERKYLLKSIPSDLTLHRHDEICQGYVAFMKDGTEVRLRKKGRDYFLTVKRGGGRVRLEVETLITKRQFDKLWPLTENMRIEKIRYRLPYKKHIVEIDVYQGKLKGLVTAEIEFRSLASSTVFTPPSWFGRDITEETRYKNRNLAIYGLPKSRLASVRKSLSLFRQITQ